MKEQNINTSKGNFLVVDYDNKELFSKFLLNVFKKYNIQNNHKRYKLSEITEEQASEIVDYALFDIHFRDYLFTPTLDDTFAGEFRLNTAIESLHSLLKSKGIHLFENPFKTESFKGATEAQIQRAEQKTFRNPYIFKIND